MENELKKEHLTTILFVNYKQIATVYKIANQYFSADSTYLTLSRSIKID